MNPEEAIEILQAVINDMEGNCSFKDALERAIESLKNEKPNISIRR